VLLLSALLGLALVAVTFNTIRLQISPSETRSSCAGLISATPRVHPRRLLSRSLLGLFGGSPPWRSLLRDHRLESAIWRSSHTVWLGHPPAIPDSNEMIRPWLPAVALAGWCLPISEQTCLKLSG